MNKYKKLIENYEEINTCSQYFVKAVNIKETKDKVYADIILKDEDHVERYMDCEYPKSLFKEVVK